MIKGTMSEGTFEQLEWFSNGANKVAPSHPADAERWRDFVIEAHKERASLPADDLAEWLRDQGFPEDVASDLADDYERGRALLRQYDG